MDVSAREKTAVHESYPYVSRRLRIREYGRPPPLAQRAWNPQVAP